MAGRSGAKTERSIALTMKDNARTRNPTATTSPGTGALARFDLPPAGPAFVGIALVGTESVDNESVGTLPGAVGAGLDMIVSCLKKAAVDLPQQSGMRKGLA